MILRTLTLCMATIGCLAAPMQADQATEIEFHFQYDTSMPAERLYDAIEARAAEVCKEDDHTDIVLFYAARVERQCRAEIAAQIVDALNTPEIFAYHNYATQQDEPSTQSASLASDQAE